jgi:DNA-directed RNA polymerase subunit RPC12/RpoP
LQKTPWEANKDPIPMSEWFCYNCGRRIYELSGKDILPPGYTMLQRTNSIAIICMWHGEMFIGEHTPTCQYICTECKAPIEASDLPLEVQEMEMSTRE